MVLVTPIFSLTISSLCEYFPNHYGSSVHSLTYYRHITLPPRSLFHWNPCIYSARSSYDFSLGSLSPPKDDPITPPPSCQVNESGRTVYVTCKLDPSQFQNSFLRDKEQREGWTDRQRQKALSAISGSRLVSHQDLVNYVSIDDFLYIFAHNGVVGQSSMLR